MPDRIYELYHGDNLEIMRSLPSESIDLIYIDPPYFSQRNYGDFDDRWKSIQHYLNFMVERLKEMHRLLKLTGSIYVHLDWHAVHYIKVEMDKMFGYSNFQNEIIWFYKTQGASKRHFSRKHDTILFYTKSLDWTFNPQKEKSYMKHRYGFKKSNFMEDEIGQYSIVYQKDVFEISALGSATSERIGYLTQKPIKLMERIILASSNKGDLVADFFCGSGSFIKTAYQLDRNCIGCDSNEKAINLSKLNNEQLSIFDLLKGEL